MSKIRTKNEYVTLRNDENVYIIHITLKHLLNRLNKLLALFCSNCNMVTGKKCSFYSRSDNVVV